MEKKFLEKIKSKYVLQLVFTFIWDENYIYKIFKYSKFYQDKLNLDFKYIPQNIIIFDKYLLDANENSLKNDSKIFGLESNKIKFDIINYFRNHPKKNFKGFNLYEFSIDIDILSPLFDILIKEDFFENMFNIVIDLDKLDENNKMCEKLEELNKINLSSFSFKFYGKKGDINKFKKYFINIHKIKKIEINFDGEIKYAILDIITNNLIYLKFESNRLWVPFDFSFSFFLDNINKFKSLNYLELSNFDLYYNKKNFKILDNFFKNLKSLILINSNFDKVKDGYIKLPKLELLSIDFFSKKNNYKNVIDFKSLKNLKYFKGPVYAFLSLDCKLLKSVKSVNIIDVIDVEDWKYIFEKINKIKNLEEFSIKIIDSSLKIDFECIENNESVKKVYLDLIYDYDCELYDFQKKFPNLTDFLIHITFCNSKNSGKLKIIENPDFKVNKIEIDMKNNNNLEVYCQSYAKLKYFKLYVDNTVNIKESIPLFSKNCYVLFTSLQILDLSLNHPRDDSEELNNLYNNIDKIQNLKEFNILASFYQGALFYEKFISQILNLKFIKKINIQRTHQDKKNENYTRELLKEKFPNVNLNNIYEINIEKYEEKKETSFFYSIYSTFNNLLNKIK